jgi:hypothetical protein
LRKEIAAEGGPEFLEVTRMATEAERKDGGGDEAGRGSAGGSSILFGCLRMGDMGGALRGRGREH